LNLHGANDRDFLLKDFVGLYYSVFTEEECEIIIDFFESNIEYTLEGRTATGVDKKVKDSIDLQLMPTTAAMGVAPGFYWYKDAERHKWIVDTLKERMSYVCKRYYDDIIGALNIPEGGKIPINPITGFSKFTSWQIQKYSKGGTGYPAVHTENDHPLARNRILAPLIYLNNVKSGGETEISLAKLKVQPKTGSVLIIPTQPPWYHCGHSAPNEDKYVITTWLEYMTSEEILDVKLRECETDEG